MICAYWIKYGSQNICSSVLNQHVAHLRGCQARKILPLQLLTSIFTQKRIDERVLHVAYLMKNKNKTSVSGSTSRKPNNVSNHYLRTVAAASNVYWGRWVCSVIQCYLIKASITITQLTTHLQRHTKIPQKWRDRPWPAPQRPSTQRRNSFPHRADQCLFLCPSATITEVNNQVSHSHVIYPPPSPFNLGI